MLGEIFGIVSQIGVYPVLVLLWMKIDASQKARAETLQFLKENCPYCGHIRIITGGN